MEILLGLGLIALGIFSLYRRSQSIEVDMIENRFFGMRDTPGWRRWYRLTATLRGILVIVIGVIFVAVGIFS